MALFEKGARRVSILTNLNQQPYPQPDLGTWVASFATGGAGTTEYRTGGIYGLPYMRMTWTTAATSATGGIERIVPAGALVPGTTYTVSGYVRATRSQTVYPAGVFYTSAGTQLSFTAGAAVNIGSNTWYWLSVTFVAPANSSGVGLRFFGNTSSNGSNWAVNDTLDVTGLMLTEGGAVPYFDGSFSLASWESAIGNSKSKTPALFGIYPISRLFEMGQPIVTSGHTIGQPVLLEQGTISAAQPMTLYAAHSAGVASSRSSLTTAAGASVVAVGRNSGGTAWFALAMTPSGSSAVPSVTKAASASVISGVRNQTYVAVHSLGGNLIYDSIAITGWPQTSTVDRVNIASDVKGFEVWSAIHPSDIRFARMSELKSMLGLSFAA